jgi:hypothetical protein
VSDDLIGRLADDLRPVPPLRHSLLLCLGLVVGGGAALVLMLNWIGLRGDLASAAGTFVFWSKFAYTLAMTLLGLWAADRLARPGGRLRAPLLGVFAVLVLIGAGAIVQLATSAPEDIRTLVLGGSALVCPFYIVALSLPVFALSVLVMRRLAPTNLAAAGFAAGLLSGAAGSWVYAFHCGESGLPFVTLWYTTGILAVALLGAATGRWLMRW